MTTEASTGTPVRYLDRAMTQLRDLGLVPDETHTAPIVDLLNRITGLDEERVVVALGPRVPVGHVGPC